MTRTYARETKHFDRTVIAHLVETGQATFFPGADVYVVKTEEGTVAVRPHQIIEITTPLVTQPVEVRVASPMDGYQAKENYDGEDTGPGGVVYDDALELAEAWVALGMRHVDPLKIVRDILDDEDGEYAVSLREAIEDARQAARPAPRRQVRRSGMTSDEERDLLMNFS